MNKCKRIISVLLSFIMVMSFMPLSVSAAATEAPAKAPSMDYIKAMMDAQHLVETIGVRLTGTNGEAQGLDYLEAQYEKLGYDIERQDFTLETRTCGDVLIGNGDMIVSGGTPSKNANFTGFGIAQGTSVYLEDPAKAAELGDDLSGKIVFFPGNCRVASGKAVSQATYDAIAKINAANAEGIVVMMDASTETTERYQIRVSTPNFANAAVNMQVDIPVLITNAIDRDKLTAYFGENTNQRVVLSCRDQVDSQNLIVTKKAAVDTDKTIYVTCHIDSVLASPGANDNASGIVGVLAMARAFKNIDTNYNIKFITFGAEEVGLQGAYYFANNMTEEEIDDAIGNYNLDMIATSQADCQYIFMNSSTNSSAPVNDPSLETHVTKMAREASKALGFDQEYYRTCYDRTTDHYALHQAGIPAVEFDWRANAEGTAFEAYYHTRYDDFEHNFSAAKLKKQLDIISQAVFNDATADYAAVTGEGVYREYYTSVAEAIAVTENGGTIKLMKDCSDIIAVNEEKAFTIESDGYAFTGAIEAGEGLALTEKDDIYLIKNATDTVLDTLNLDYDAAMADAEYLVETIGVRLAGTKNEIAGLDYIESQYEKLGYDIERQGFTVESRTAGDIAIGGMNISAGTPSKNANFTGFVTAKGTAVYLDDPAKAAELGDDLSGKIVFFPGNCRVASGKPVSQATYDAIAKLYAAKAAGIVVMMDPATETTERYQIRVSTPNFANAAVNMQIDIPVLVTNAMDMERLTAYFAKNTGKTAEMTCHPQVVSQNLIVTKKAAVDTEKTIYITSHIDSVLASPGANDNASGIVGVLAMARALKDVDTNYNIKFITFGSEEIGLQGAHYFAKNMTEKEIDDAIGNYNLDMIATSQENCVYIFMNSSTDSKAAVNAPELETHVTRMAKEASKSLGFDQEYYRTCYDRTTDHYALHLVGIPAVEFDWRANAEGTSFEAYYHTRFDDFEHNFSVDKLRKQLDIITLAVYNDATADYAAVTGEGVYRTYYTSVADAIAAVENGGTIRLMKDCNEIISMDEAAKFAIDTEGYQFSAAIEGEKGFGCKKEIADTIYSFEIYPCTEHNFVQTARKEANCENDGYIDYQCDACGETKTDTIAKIDEQKLSYTTAAYNGKTRKPAVIVKDTAGRELVSGEDFDVTYPDGRTKVGRYKVTVTYKNNYSGKKDLYFTIVPKAPETASATLSTASQTSGYDDVKFTWKAATGATGYMVYYKKASADKWSEPIVTTKTSYTKKNLTDGTKYTFKVVPYYKTEQGTKKYYGSKQYKTASVVTLKKITDVKVAKSGTKVKVSWTNISGETGYQISRTTKKSAVQSQPLTIKTTTGKSKIITATEGKTYYYKVRAYKVVDGKKVYGPWSEAKAFQR